MVSHVPYNVFRVRRLSYGRFEVDCRNVGWLKQHGVHVSTEDWKKSKHAEKNPEWIWMPPLRLKVDGVVAPKLFSMNGAPYAWSDVIPGSLQQFVALAETAIALARPLLKADRNKRTVDLALDLVYQTWAMPDDNVALVAVA